jgi:hypothetical protein
LARRFGLIEHRVAGTGEIKAEGNDCHLLPPTQCATGWRSTNISSSAVSSSKGLWLLRNCPGRWSIHTESNMNKFSEAQTAKTLNNRSSAS